MGGATSSGTARQRQHPACALEFFQRSPTRIELIEQFGMDGIGFFQLAPIVLIRAALWEIVGVFPIQLGKLLQRVVAVMELVSGDFLEQPPPDDLVAFLLTRRSPRRFHTAEGLLESSQRLLTTFAADLDLLCRK